MLETLSNHFISLIFVKKVGEKGRVEPLFGDVFIGTAKDALGFGAENVIEDESALIEAIKTGKVAGAWLDVFSEEPYKGPLAEFPQVILTPHIGSHTKECRTCMEIEAADNLLKHFKN